METVQTGNQWIDNGYKVFFSVYVLLTSLGGLLSLSAKSRQWRVTRAVVTVAGDLAKVLSWLRGLLGKGLASETAKSVALLFVMGCFLGCSFSLERAKAQSAAGGTNAPSPMCLSLDNSRGTWSAIEQASIVCAGASGISALPLEDKYQLAAGGTIIGCAIIAGASHIIAQSKSEQWARYCATEPESPEPAKTSEPSK